MDVKKIIRFTHLHFLSTFGTRTKLKCSFRIRSAESLLPNTHVTCAVPKWWVECFQKSFSSISFKSTDSYRKSGTIVERLNKMALFAFLVFFVIKTIINCFMSNTSNISLFFQAEPLEFLGDLIF